ncbi:MAG TPA: ester cyclase [Leptospiraceae bacterium]|nr:ester cyclase [Leptospiraceae bacterium]HMW06942.1 ester cyclase [Leptospiraceae bacterium]HMY30590.1 ester cyclase [Leptospiraceae bacterium]HMZ66721.1 ester cyclase [Leptospiraceae bacterium]HNA10182.1 ester cyclase [Leptospiraceae bacterium]
MSNPSPKEIIHQWIEAYNSHNPEQASSLYDLNVINTQFPWGKSVQGKDAMRNTYINIFKAFPDIHIQAENILETKDWAIVEWRFSGTMKGDFAGHPPNHNVFDMNGCEMFQIANGKIIIQHGYWDKATMFTQLKIPL